MPGYRISELPRKEFDVKDIDNIFYVENLKDGYNLQAVPFTFVFEQFKTLAKQCAKEDGLTVILKEDRIVFVKQAE